MNSRTATILARRRIPARYECIIFSVQTQLLSDQWFQRLTVYKNTLNTDCMLEANYLILLRSYNEIEKMETE